jgi:hypothetical protein
MQACLATLPASLRAQVLKLRDAIRAAAPEAVESFVHGMPAFELDGKNFVWYGALEDLDPDGDLPASLIVRLVRTRIAEPRKQAKTPQ